MLSKNCIDIAGDVLGLATSNLKLLPRHLRVSLTAGLPAAPVHLHSALLSCGSAASHWLPCRAMSRDLLMMVPHILRASLNLQQAGLVDKPPFMFPGSVTKPEVGKSTAITATDV
jgi:hypothetical protein